MKTNPKIKSRLSAGAILLGVVTFGNSVANAQVISDTFTGATGTALTAHTPDTNLPGGSYFVASQGGTPSIQGNAASLDTNASAFISIASNGTYTKPTDFTISAALTLGNVESDNQSIFPPGYTFIRGVGLGFVSSDDTSFGAPTGNFTGLVLTPNGSLDLEVGGNGFVQTSALGSMAYNAADFGGASFSTTTAYTLTYSVDTTTGGISGVSLSDAMGSETYSFTSTAFTGAATTDAGFIVSAGNGGGTGTVDNFLVTGPGSSAAVPEPSTCAMMLAGFVALLGINRFVRKA